MAIENTSAQSNFIDYALHTLGWKAFQDLCITISKEVFGQTVQSFNSSQDGGRDGAFHGIWENRNDNTVLSGAFTFQCKYTSKANTNLALSHMKEEIRKAKKLAKQGLCRNYILMTNYSVSGKAEEALRHKYLSITGIERFLIFGKEWISQQIQETTRLRMLVPRLYGLGDLSQILDERVYQQASEILFSMRDNLSKFVITDAYRRSVEALTNYGLVVLIGEAASGKSTIAASLAIAAADQWKASIVKIVEPKEFQAHWNVNEKCQLFWIDDAFGTTQYQKDRVLMWNYILPYMKTAVNKGSRIILTSRDYIYKAACETLKVSEFPIMQTSQVIIKVQEILKTERDQILYNHIKLGDQPKHFKSSVKPFLPIVAAHYNYSPEIARRLGSQQFTINMGITQEGILGFVDKPKELLQEIIQSLDVNSRASLGILFMRNGLVETNIAFSEREIEMIEALGAAVPGVRTAFGTLNGSLINIIKRDGNQYWTYKHPTINDAFSSMISRDPELLVFYLERTPADVLMREVTCGDVGLGGEQIIVPNNKYPIIAKRLKELKSPKMLMSFISYRCNKEFMGKYIVCPQLKNWVLNIYSYLSACDEVYVMCRLKEFDLLPEDWRLEFVAKAESLIMATPDSDFLSDKRIRNLFTEKELSNIMDKIRIEMIPDLDNIIIKWEEDCSFKQADSYFDPLEETLREFGKYFVVDNNIVSQIEIAINKIEIIRKEIVGDEAYFPEGSILADDESTLAMTNRSIFDDIDQ